MNPPINIRDVVEDKLYIVTNQDNEILGIIQAHGGGGGYGDGGGSGLVVQYVNIEADEEGKIEYKLIGEEFELLAGDDTETSDGLRLHNIEHNKPSAGGKRKPRRSQKNKSKSKKGGSKKSKKGGSR
jgi:hypothetical protein